MFLRRKIKHDEHPENDHSLPEGVVVSFRKGESPIGPILYQPDRGHDLQVETGPHRPARSHLDVHTVADQDQSQPRLRPALFLCDEYQSFATVGEDDSSENEMAFALTRQSRVIPIVATQSISSREFPKGWSEGAATGPTLRSEADGPVRESPTSGAAPWDRIGEGDE